VVAAFYSAQFFSGFNDVLRYQLDTRSDTKGAAAHLELMGKPTGALGKQVERYAADISAAEQRALALDTLVKDLTALGQLGAGALKRMTDVVLDQGGYTPQMQLAETALYACCDSRLECRSLLERVADQGTKDLVLGDRLRSSLVAEAPRHFASARLRHALLSRDRVETLSAFGDRSLAISRRAWYLANWGKWLDVAAVRRAFDGLLAEDPYDHDVREHYGRFLTDRGEQEAALVVFDVYLKQDPSKDAHPLHRLGIRAQKARALQELGRLDEARDLVEPDVRSMYGASLGRTAYVRSARGEHDDAIEMAERRLERYPDGSSVSLLTQMYWQAGRDDDAAELLEQWSQRLTIDDWQRHLAAAFTDVFEKQPVDRAVAAFGAITKRQVDPMGARLLVQVAELSPEHKFRALVQLPTTGYRRHHEAGRLYNWMKRWKGEAEAQKFIAEYLPEGTRDPLAQFGYTTRNYDLIWTFVPDLPETHQHVAFLWLMRTASYLRTKERPAEWRAKLDARYADPAARPHPHDQMAMFLLGKLDADTLWKVSDGADHRPEAAWILGLKAELEGDLPTAIHWYRACMQGGRGNSGEVQWSSDSLSGWSDAQKSLSVLARDVNEPEDETL
jgi:tetratricopeptide (TPR) repeat protein